MINKLKDVIKRAKEVCEELAGFAGTTAAMAPYPITAVGTSPMVKYDEKKKKSVIRDIQSIRKTSQKSN